MKLSISIMAHPEREEWAEELGKKLDAPFIYDEKSNVWDTCRRSWLAYDEDADYHLVLQDDSIICDDFKKEAKKIIKTTDLFEGEFIISFFAGQLMKKKVEKAERNKRNYITSGMIFNEIALCMKTEYIEDMVKFCDEREADTDHYIQKWAHKNRLKIFYPIPSLVDHREGESIFRRNYDKPEKDKVRKAVKFIGKK